jgi:hypothetical protein
LLEGGAFGGGEGGPLVFVAVGEQEVVVVGHCCGCARPVQAERQ